MTRSISIASLQPFDSTPTNASVRGEIGLLWPFSSSTASLAILLVDQDYRRRHERGQIRVCFKGLAARALARAHLGIGDVVSVELTAARWKERDERALNLTPGKAVEAELVFESKLRLTILEDGTGGIDGKVIEVDEKTSTAGTETEVPSTPVQHRAGLGGIGLRTSFGGGYASPAFMKRLRLSQDSFLSSPGLMDDGDDLDSNESRKRRKVAYKNVVEWKTTHHTPVKAPSERTAEDDEVDSMLNGMFGTPVEERQHTSEARVQDIGLPDKPTSDRESVLSMEVTKTQHPTMSPSSQYAESGHQHESLFTPVARRTQDSLSAVTDAPPLAPMLPPPLPRLSMPAQGVGDVSERSSSPVTPRLAPVSATVLPLPSPFPQTPLTRSPAPLVPSASILGTSVAAIDTKAQPDTDYFGSKKIDPEDTIVPGYQQESAVDLVNEPTTPLAHVLQHPQLLESQVEGHASPSSGSEADISSDDAASFRGHVDAVQQARDTASLDETDVNMQGSTSSPRLLGPAIPKQEEDQTDRIQAEGDQVEQVQDEADDSEKAELSGVEEPSDDESDDLSPVNLASGVPDPDSAVIEEESSLELPDPGSEGASLAQEAYLARQASLAQENHGAASYRVGMADAEDARPLDESVVPTDRAHESQDEDAAFAAMDEAIHELQDGSLEMQQAPPPPLASTVLPAHQDLSRRPDDVLPIVGQNEKYRVAHPQMDSPEDVMDHKLEQIEVTTKSRLSLNELKDQARARSAAQRAMTLQVPQKQRSPSVEVIDLSGVTQDGFILDSYDYNLQVPPSEKSVADSLESPVTTLAADSSRPVSRAEEVTTRDMNGGILEASQELGHLSGKLVKLHSASDEVATNVHEANDEEEEGGFDDKLLAGLVEKGGDEMTHNMQLTTEDLSQSLGSRLGQKERPSNLDGQQAANERKEVRIKERPNQRLSSRLSVIPNALNAWFSKPADKTKDPDPDRRKTTSAISHTKPPSSTAPLTRTKSTTRPSKQRTASVSPPPIKRYAQSQGLVTSLTYFTPLTNLDIYLNNPAVRIDVIAVATDASAEPRRAKAGPRDWYTVFHVTDPQLYEAEETRLAEVRRANGASQVPETGGSEKRQDVRVEVFRPWKASLPAVSEGDIILLRAFAVKSRGRRDYLLSGEESAWCAFRAAVIDEGGEGEKARRRHWNEALREEMRGPPFEVGSEEREKAGELSGWWDLVRVVGKKGKGRATL